MTATVLGGTAEFTFAVSGGRLVEDAAGPIRIALTIGRDNRGYFHCTSVGVSNGDPEKLIGSALWRSIPIGDLIQRTIEAIR